MSVEQRVKQAFDFLFVSDPAGLERMGLGRAFKDFFDMFIMQSGGKAVERWAAIEKMAKFPSAQDLKTLTIYTQASGNRIPLTYNSLASELLKLHPGVTSQNIGALEKDYARQSLLRRATEPLGYARRHASVGRHRRAFSPQQLHLRDYHPHHEHEDHEHEDHMWMAPPHRRRRSSMSRRY